MVQVVPARKAARLALSSLSKAALKPLIDPPAAGIGPNRIVLESNRRDPGQSGVDTDVRKLPNLVQVRSDIVSILDFSRFPRPRQAT